MSSRFIHIVVYTRIFQHPFCFKRGSQYVYLAQAGLILNSSLASVAWVLEFHGHYALAFASFMSLNNISLFVYTIFCLSIHLSVDIQLVSTFWLLPTILLWVLIWKYLFKYYNILMYFKIIDIKIYLSGLKHLNCFIGVSLALENAPTSVLGSELHRSSPSCAVWYRHECASFSTGILAWEYPTFLSSETLDRSKESVQLAVRSTFPLNDFFFEAQKELLKT